MAQLPQTSPSENWKPRFSSMSQKSKKVFNFFPMIKSSFKLNFFQYPTGDAGIDIDVEFPAQYPSVKPSFDVIKAKNLDSVAQTNIVQAMKDKSLKHVKKSQACLEPCIR